MSIFRKTQVQTLSEWLEIATRKLTAASKERIRVEIEAHYAEAVEAHHEDGLTEADAQTKALMELGDAKTAARRFRKQHLTEREDRRLKDSEKMGRSIWWLIFSYFFFAEQFALLRLRRNAPIYHRYGYLGLVLEFAVLIALPAIRFAIARLGGTKSNKHLLVPDPIIGFFLAMNLNELFTTDFARFDVYLKVFFALIFLIHYLLNIRIWSKLGKMGSIGSHTPPPDPARF